MGTDFCFVHYPCRFMTDKTRDRYGGCKYSKNMKYRNSDGNCRFTGWCKKASDWVHNLSGCPVSQKTEDE